MDDCLTFPPVRAPSVLPHPNNLFVSLCKDEYSSSVRITNPLNPDTIPDNNEARAAIHAMNRVCQALTSPTSTPDAILDRPTWLRMIMETLASVHEGFHNMQLAAPDGDPPVNFRNLSPDELNTVARIYEITGYIHDFCKLPDDDQQDNTFRALCIRCVEAADLPSPPAHITSIMLSNALEARAIRDSLRNQAIQDAIHDIDTWREEQRTALIDGLVHDITSDEPDPETLARTLGNLDPCIGTWVDSFRLKLKETVINMVAAEPIKDHLAPQAQELLDLAWTEKRAHVTEELQARLAQLTADSDTFLANHKAALQADADQRLQAYKAELEVKTSDEIQQLKNKSKTLLQHAKDTEEESRTLSLAIRTPKATKPSPLNLSKPKRKKKKVTVLDLTTPPPGNEGSASSDMDTDVDGGSTPTTPICRSTAPSPSPFPLPPVITATTPLPQEAPETVATTIADPDSIPRWARTPTPEEKTPHAPSFPINPVPAPDNMSAILAAITGLRTKLLGQIEKVNARVDLATGPQTIADHVVWNNENMAAWEHPGYVDPIHDTDMENLAEANAAREADRLAAQRAFRTLHHHFVAEKKMTEIDNDNDLYLEKWYDVCSALVKSMNWDALAIPHEADDTILNAWRCAECSLNEEEYQFSTHAIFERITGTKPDLSTTDGRARFNTFTSAYNEFCAMRNFSASEGFPDSSDDFFTYFLANFSKPTALTTPAPNTTTPSKPKSVRFTSAPPIATLPPVPSSSPEEFPTLQASNKAPISYASAASSFTPVTRRRRGKSPSTTAQPTPAPSKTPNPAPKSGPKPTKPTKPPLPDALKTTKHTIILDHTLPDTKALYSMNAGEVTLGLQRHLEAVKAPLVLLAGSWSTAPFYKNFILTFSVIVPFTDITKYNSILFGPFGLNCRAAPTAGYQSILISGVRLQRDVTGKLASPKMLFDELCRNPVFVGRLPLAAPRWLFNPEKLLTSNKQSSSITFSFHDPMGEGLELMRRSRVGMFGKLVTIHSWEARPLLSQCTWCLRLGHTVDRCRRHKDLVVCSKCGGAHEDALHHFNCPRSDRHKGRGCDCPPTCFLCIVQGNHKAAQGHTSTSATCPIWKHFRAPVDDTTPAQTRGRSTTIPPTPAADAPMHLLTSTDIRKLSAKGVSTEAITRLLVPPEVANLASTSSLTAN